MADGLLFHGVMVIAVIILGLSKGGFAGIGMVSTPMVALVTDPLTAVSLMLPIMILQDLMVVLIYRRSYDRAILAVMLPGGIAGIAAAYFFAKNMSEAAILGALGIISLIFSIWQIWLYFRAAPAFAKPHRYDRALGFAAGVASGFASAIAHAGTPPYQIYAMSKQLRPEIYVGTSVFLFATVNVLKLPSFAALGLINAENMKTSAIYFPLAALSSWVGSLLVLRIDPQHFKFAITLILLFVSLVLVFQALGQAGLL
jgi:uncharacterized protein